MHSWWPAQVRACAELKSTNDRDVQPLSKNDWQTPSQALFRYHVVQATVARWVRPPDQTPGCPTNNKGSSRLTPSAGVGSQCTAGVSLVCACTKWDVLKGKADPEGLRVLAAALRWVAHSSAGHLVFTGGLQPGATGEWGPSHLLVDRRSLSWSLSQSHLTPIRLPVVSL